MNTEDDNEENRSETQGKNDNNAESESLESRVVLSSETPDGTGDHLPLLENKATSSDINTKVDGVSKNQVEDNCEKPIHPVELGDGDEEMNEDKIQDTFDSTIITSEDNLGGALVVLSKPKSLEGVSSKILEDLDSENQNEELVLRWDEDEVSTIMSVKDDKLDKNLDQDIKQSEIIQKKSVEMDKIDLVQQYTIDSTNITSEDHLEEALVVPPKPTFLEGSSSIISEDLDSENQDEELVLKWDEDEVSPVMSQKNDELDEKIDQGIKKSEVIQKESMEMAEIGLEQDLKNSKVTQKESEVITKIDLEQDLEKIKAEVDLEQDFEKPKQIQKETADIAEMDLVQDINKSEVTQNESEVITKVDIDKKIEIPKNTRKESAEMAEINLEQDEEPKEKESAEIAGIDNFVKKEVSTNDLIEEPELRMSEDDADDDQEDLLSEIDAQIAELGASISKAENENLMIIDNSHQTKIPTNEFSVSSKLSLEKVILLDKVEEIEKKPAKDMPTAIAQKPENKNQESEMDIEEALLADDDNTLETNTDCITQSVDTISDNNKNTEIVMETNISVNLKDPDLSIDGNQKEGFPNNLEVLANSTKLDNSLDNGDTGLEISCNDDTFAHDSSTSIDRVHGVNKPNVMLEIPTQELIDLDESALSTQGKEMSEDEKEMSVEENEMEDTNASVDLTDDKDSANQVIGGKGPEKALDNESIIIGKQSILTDNNKLELEVSQDIEKPNMNVAQITKDSTASKEDVTGTNLEMKKIQEVNKQIELPESAKENLTIVQRSEDIQPKPGTSTTKDDTTTLKNLPETDSKPENCLSKDTSTEIAKDTKNVQPSTSQAGLQPALDPSDDAAEVAEATDSLGLLAESSRVRDDEDDDGEGDVDGDDQETSDHDDYDPDFDPDDESSNQHTAEHSEDSTQNSETDMPKPQETNKETMDTDKPFGIIESITKVTDDTDITQSDATVTDVIESVDQEMGDKEFGFEISNVVSGEGDAKEAVEDIDIDDEIVCGEVEVTENTPDIDQPIEDVGTSTLQDIPDAPDKAEVPCKVLTDSKLRELLQKPIEEIKSPKKKLEIAKLSHVVSIVDLESSSEDEGVQKPASEPNESVTSINISKEIEVMSSGDNTSEIVSKEGETVITVPKHKTLQKIKSRLNTSEITIKTASPSESPTLVIPETKMGEVKEAPKSKFGELEVFNLDSDEEDSPLAAAPVRAPTPEPEPEKPPSKCINSACTSDHSAPFFPADPSTAAFYDSQRKKRAMVCQICLIAKMLRAQRLVEGVKNFTPLLALEGVRSTQELVEISDSDSDDEAGSDTNTVDKIGLDNMPMLERQLSEMLNETWERFKMDARLKEAQDELHAELDQLEQESKEVNAMLDECQLATDKLRSDLYATFEVERHQLPGLVIHDAPDKFYICPEPQTQSQITQQQEQVSSKRRLSSASESQAKKPAVQPATPLANTAETVQNNVTVKSEEPKSELDLKAADASKLDDDKDISVVNLSAEAAPADLPPPGETVRAPLQINQTIFAMRHAFGSWIKARVLEVTPKGSSVNAQNFTMCRVKFDNKTSRNAYKLLPARCLAYFEPSSVRMTIGTRVIALFRDTSADKSGKRESFYSGVVAEVPNPVNKYRYLVFFDDGYAQYVVHSDTRLVCEFASLVWEEVHPFSREFVREYLVAYPERPMVRLHTGQSLKTEWNGKWWLSRVVQVDASLVQVYFEQDKRTEWIYRGSTRLAPLYLELQAAEKHRARPLPRNRMQNKLNMPYVEYTRFDEQLDPDSREDRVKAQQEEMRRQRSVAKKSTAPANLPPQQPVAGNLDAVTSRVVYYTPKNAVKPYKMTPHTCSFKCKRTDVLALKDLRTYNPLAKPLLSGWERQIVRYKGHKEVMYRAPCGRRLRNIWELHRYLRTITSDMGVDLFDFGPNTHCLAEFVLNKCIVGKKDLSHGKENVPVPCVNYYDDSLPEFCSYNTERTPTAGVPLCLDPEFLCGCDCTDDCQDKSKCACWQMTLEGARTIGLDGNVGYVYKRLPDPLPSGIYECNSRCKCKSTCLNRVAQHPLQLKLQVFKTLNRGWGIRALNDVPKGSFLCIYAGNLLTDATANLDGLNEGDEYLAELDYIEVVEQMKEGYEDDIPEQDKKLDRKESGQAETESEESESEEETRNSKSDADDGEYDPGYMPGGISGFSKRLRKRDRKKKEAEKNQRDKDGNREANQDDCITISDDEELREPSRFAAQAGMGGAFISKYRSVRTLFGKDEACYIMDAKVQGNIGRYLNHSCSPNVFVQNVFVDTHDPRFPWVAFFALTHIRAGTELTWNYNYDVGSVPGKALYCYCGAPNCRGRLL